MVLVVVEPTEHHQMVVLVILVVLVVVMEDMEPIHQTIDQLKVLNILDQVILSLHHLVVGVVKVMVPMLIVVEEVVVPLMNPLGAVLQE